MAIVTIKNAGELRAYLAEVYVGDAEDFIRSIAGGQIEADALVDKVRDFCRDHGLTRLTLDNHAWPAWSVISINLVDGDSGERFKVMRAVTPVLAAEA